MKYITGVIGNPIHHSLSPIIHNAWLDALNIDGFYISLNILPSLLHDTIQKLAVQDNMIGFNVTIPYKESVLKICDELSVTAKKIGSVNKLSFSNGRVYGDNTDGHGFIQNLIFSAPQSEIVQSKMENAIITLIGAGGSSRAILHAISEYNIAEIRIVNRTLPRIESLVNDILGDEFDRLVSMYDFESIDTAIQDANIVINSTNCGMNGENLLPLQSLDHVNPNGIIYDIVYSPLDTQLLSLAKEANLHVVSGIGMLIFQAIPCFQSWYNFSDIDKRKLYDIAMDRLQTLQYIA